MNLDLINSLFNNLKENEFVQNFMKELSEHLENNIGNNSNTASSVGEWNNLLSNDLTIDNQKVISKYRDEMLTERNNILQKYAENIKETGEMYYIYNISENQKNSYNLSNCTTEKSNEVITKQIEELPEGVRLGSVLREQNGSFILDVEATKIVGEEINQMIQEKLKQQDEYLDSKRIEGHVYEVGEKYSGRIWLYDLNNNPNSGMEGIEEIEFPKDLYQTAKEGDLFIYKNGEYQKQ